ncbi:MAG: DUF58 domain-containing protein [Anaerolineales bacterium]|nr:DUF58 domain-containing protein [Anaerolineales bacterium]
MTTSLRVVIGLLGLSLLALAITGSPIYTRLSYLWGLLLAVSYVWSRISLEGVELSRDHRSRRAQMGSIFEERFEIQNTSRVPRLWLEIRDQSSLPNSMGSQVLTLIGGRQGRSYISRTRLIQRGIFPMGPTTIRSGDPFGLFPVSRQFPAVEALMVYPLMVDVRVFPNPPGLMTGGEAQRQRTPQATTNAAGVREYVVGDPLNRIHWVSTARRNQLIVKEFELDPQSDIWIFLDADGTVQSSLPYQAPSTAAEVLWKSKERVELPPSTEEYGVSIAASISRYYLRKGRAVGLVFNTGAPTVLPPDRDARQLDKILEALALLRAGGEMEFSALVTGQAQYLVRGSTVILITSSMRERVVGGVDLIQRRGLRPIVLLLDAGTFGGPPGAEATEIAIKAMNVPTRRIEYGDDLETVLNHVGR